MSRHDANRIIDYLEHVLEAIERIEEYTEDIAEVAFLENELIQDAVIRNIEIIGEAAHKVEQNHPEFADQHNEIPWGDMYFMRNRVSHGYFSVDMEIVWKTVENDLPELYQQVKKLYDKLEK